MMHHAASVVLVAGVLLAGASVARAEPDVAAVAQRLADDAVYVEPGLERVVDAERLRHATSIASRAADGAPIKLAFVDVPDESLDAFRDRLAAAVDLDERGALVVATQVSITMLTMSLPPITEESIIGVAAFELRRPPRNYTEALSELVYDTGLVIHNSTPGAVPRGDGNDSNLRTFDGRFAGERSRDATAGLIIAVALTTLAGGWLVAAGIRSRSDG